MIGGFMGMRQKAAGPGLGPLMYQMAGNEQQAAARDEANALSRQGSLAYEDALLEAARIEYQGKAFKEDQALKMASNGSFLTGSNLGVLYETQALTDMEANAARKRGSELSKLYEMQGLAMLRRGSAAAFSGMVSSMQSQYESRVQAYNQGQANMSAGLAGISSGIQGIGAFFSGLKN